MTKQEWIDKYKEMALKIALYDINEHKDYNLSEMFDEAFNAGYEILEKAITRACKEQYEQHNKDLDQWT